MPWVRLDDQFTDHPKVVQAGPMAAWLYVCGLAYCARQLTDGFVPAAQLRRLLPTGSVTQMAQRLIDVGLWEPAPGGYRVHDYLDYNPTRQQTLAIREQRASAGRKGGWQKAGKLLAACQPSATTPVPIPVPIPSPTAATSTEHPQEDVAEGESLSTAPPAPARSASPPGDLAVPKVPTVAARAKAALTARCEERFGQPSNDAGKRRLERAVALFWQSKCEPHEVDRLADEYERRDWPAISALTVAKHIDDLRRPATGRANGHAVPKAWDALRNVQERRKAAAGAAS